MYGSSRAVAFPISLLLVAIFTGCLANQAPASGTGPKGRLVIEGGPKTPRHAAIYKEILDGRDGDGPLCIIPTSNADPERAIAEKISQFGANGWAGEVVGIPITPSRPEAASDSQIVSQLQKCSGFFFVGGRQIRSSRVFRPDGATTPALEAIKARYREGAVVAGTSAGAAIMSDPMINAGNGRTALAHGVGPGGVRMVPGLGFFEGELVDQHFLAQNRIGRLLVAVLQLDQYSTAFGVDENTALVVEAGRAWVAGASGVLFVDGRDAQRATEGNGGTGLRLYLMGAGDTVDLKTYRVNVDPGKKAVPTEAGAVTPPEDVFAKWQFLHLVHALARSSSNEVVAQAGDYEIVLRKEPGFAAVSLSVPGVEGVPAGLSAGPLRADIRQRHP